MHQVPSDKDNFQGNQFIYLVLFKLTYNKLWRKEYQKTVKIVVKTVAKTILAGKPKFS